MGKVPFTAQMLRELSQERKRTLTGYAALLENTECPPGLSIFILRRIFSKNPPDKIREDFYHYIIAALSVLPERVQITAEIIEILQTYQHANNIKLLCEQENAPEGLTRAIIYNWINKTSVTARKDHLEYVLSNWERAAEKSPRIEITEDIIKTLKQNQERTGAGAQAILRGTKKDRPSGLNSGIIRGWMNGGIKTASKDHLDYVLKRWENWNDIVAFGGRKET